MSRPNPSDNILKLWHSNFDNDLISLLEHLLRTNNIPDHQKEIVDIVQILRIMANDQSQFKTEAILEGHISELLEKQKNGKIQYIQRADLVSPALSRSINNHVKNEELRKILLELAFGVNLALYGDVLNKKLNVEKDVISYDDVKDGLLSLGAMLERDAQIALLAQSEFIRQFNIYVVQKTKVMRPAIIDMMALDQISRAEGKEEFQRNMSDNVTVLVSLLKLKHTIQTANPEIVIDASHSMARLLFLINHYQILNTKHSDKGFPSTLVKIGLILDLFPYDDDIANLRNEEISFVDGLSFLDFVIVVANGISQANLNPEEESILKKIKDRRVGLILAKAQATILTGALVGGIDGNLRTEDLTPMELLRYSGIQALRHSCNLIHYDKQIRRDNIYNAYLTELRNFMNNVSFAIGKQEAIIDLPIILTLSNLLITQIELFNFFKEKSSNARLSAQQKTEYLQKAVNSLLIAGELASLFSVINYTRLDFDHIVQERDYKTLANFIDSSPNNFIAMIDYHGNVSQIKVTGILGLVEIIQDRIEEICSSNIIGIRSFAYKQEDIDQQKRSAELRALEQQTKLLEEEAREASLELDKIVDTRKKVEKRFKNKHQKPAAKNNLEGETIYITNNPQDKYQEVIKADIILLCSHLKPNNEEVCKKVLTSLINSTLSNKEFDHDLSQILKDIYESASEVLLTNKDYENAILFNKILAQEVKERLVDEKLNKKTREELDIFSANCELDQGIYNYLMGLQAIKQAVTDGSVINKMAYLKESLTSINNSMRRMCDSLDLDQNEVLEMEKDGTLGEIIKSDSRLNIISSCCQWFGKITKAIGGTNQTTSKKREAAEVSRINAMAALGPAWYENKDNKSLSAKTIELQALRKSDHDLIQYSEKMNILIQDFETSLLQLPAPIIREVAKSTQMSQLIQFTQPDTRPQNADALPLNIGYELDNTQR